MRHFFLRAVFSPALVLLLLVAGAACSESARELRRANKAVSENPTDNSALKKRAWIQASLGRYEAAIRDVSSALKIDTEDAECYFMRYQFRSRLDGEAFGWEAVQDLRNAANLGHEEARLILRRHVDY